MAAVVRVKRRINEEPLSAFVLNCKKRKIENGDEVIENLYETKDEVSTVLKFAGTVEFQDEHVVSQINRLTKDEAKTLARKQRKPNSLTEKSRQEMRASLHENRFKVVNCYRAIKDGENNDNGRPNEITVVDIEKDLLQSEEQQKKELKKTETTNQIAAASTSHHIESTISDDLSEEDYVYDLYLPENDEQSGNFDYMDNYNISVKPFDNLYDDRYKNESDTQDSEDSNCEEYFTNDYPDTEEDENSIGEDDMIRAVEEFDIDGDRELSSDEEAGYNNGFVYSIDSEGIGFEDDIDYCDVNRYGEAYARYKARVLNKSPTNRDYDSEIDDDEYNSD